MLSGSRSSEAGLLWVVCTVPPPTGRWIQWSSALPTLSFIFPGFTRTRSPGPVCLLVCGRLSAEILPAASSRRLEFLSLDQLAIAPCIRCTDAFFEV